MNNNLKIIGIILIALTAGLTMGYFIFNNKKTSAPENIVHDHTDNNNNEEGIWTCSMHPQIRQNEPGICPICEMDLIPLEANTSNDPLVFNMTEAAVKLAQIQTTIIGATDQQSDKSIRLSGKVQADERLASSQVTHVPGRIEKLYVSFTGEQVRKGLKIASIYSPELIAAQNELLEAIKLKDISPGLLTAARNKLLYWKINQTTIDAIESKLEIKETFDIFAANSGVVTNKRVAVGDYIRQGAVLFDLINLDKVWIIFDAYEEDLKNITLGNTITFTTPSIPGKSFKTRITFIDPVINPNTRTAAVRAELNNNSGQLKPEMFVNGLLMVSGPSGSKLTVPKSAVLWTGKRSVVYVKEPDTNIPAFRYREVELGESTDEAYFINSGLTSGEEVVTNGSFAIDASAQLNNQQSMMNQNISIKNEENNLPDYQEQSPLEFKNQISELVKKYLEMKDAFVESNVEKVKNTANNFTQQLNQIDANLLKGDANMEWMKQFEKLKSHAEMISENEDIEAQRKQFQFVSEALIQTLKIFGRQGENLYVQYCPMVEDNKGANWIAEEENIRNPYFGDKMMKCGSVEEIISGKK